MGISMETTTGVAVETTPGVAVETTPGVAVETTPGGAVERKSYHSSIHRNQARTNYTHFHLCYCKGIDSVWGGSTPRQNCTRNHQSRDGDLCCPMGISMETTTGVAVETTTGVAVETTTGGAVERESYPHGPQSN